ncbi:MAG: DNA polymerase III subunit delta' [Candidatus Omnitrophica bacterium]|nr:DNA polymerase III subunit delta' [Candidatus Omnitrophota bacterium]
MAAGKFADVQTIELAAGSFNEESQSQTTRISVEQIEQLQHDASLPPFEGKVKVFIIDGIENLSTGAANRLLKTLEEPLPGVYFLLLASDLRRVIATVVSRCQKVELQPVSSRLIEDALIREVAVPPEKAALLARLSRGCPGWALNAARDEARLEKRTGQLDELIDIIETGTEQRLSYAATMATRFQQKREPVLEQLDMMLEFSRDLLLAKSGRMDFVTNLDRKDVLADMAARLKIEQVRDLIQSTREAAERLRLNGNARLVLDVLMLDMPQPVPGSKIPSGV